MHPARLELSIVTNAIHALSRELEMDGLLRILLQLAMENSGARTGVLLLKQDGRWSVVARGTEDSTEIELLQLLSPEECDDLPMAIISRVMRQKERLLFEDIPNTEEFANDPTILQRGIQSLLCAPLLLQDSLIGILYLASDRNPQAFPPEQVQLLELLLEQAAISIENACVYSKVKESESKYRRIVATANDGIWVIGSDSRTISVNSRMAEIIGRTVEELLGQPMSNFLFEEDIPDHLEQINRRRRGIAECYERRFQGKDGATVWTHVSASPLFDEAHRFEGSFAMFTDITERKQTEETMERLNRELRAISSCNQVLLHATEEQFLIDQICRIVCEEAAYRMAWVGYAEQDAAKTVRPVAWSGAEEGYLSTASISWSEDTPQGHGPTGIVIRSGKSHYVQDFATDPRVAPWRERALQRGYHSSIAMPLKDEHGKTFGALTIYSGKANAFTAEELRLLEEMAGDLAFGIVALRTRDERDQVEKTLALRSFALNAVHESAYLIDRRGRFHDVNDEACRLLGYSREELLNMNAAEVDLDLTPERWVGHWNTLKQKGSLTFEGRHRAKDGRSIPVAISANYFEYRGTAYNLALARDMTERDEAQKRLEESEERLRLTLEATEIGTWDWNVKTDEWYASPTYYSQLGYEPRYERPSNRSEWMERVHPEDRPSVEEQIRGVLEGRHDSYTYEARMRHADGSYRWIQAKGFGIEHGPDGKIARILGARMDITERKQIEEEQAKLRQHLQQTQKMEAIGQLAGGVAHDFNNLLGVINGYSELLLTEPELKPANREAIAEILAAGQRAASLTRQLLAFSRKLVLQPKVLSLNVVVEGFDKLLRRLIGDEIEVRTILEPELYAVHADPSQMEQVLLNFCINARDAMPAGGRITIMTKNVMVDETMAAQNHSLVPGFYVCLSVSDTGIGMDQETMSHIFEPFFTTKSPEQGTGLGLATVYGIVKQSGGYVSVYSEPGQGSTFNVYLPMAAPQLERMGQITMPPELGRGSETILLVEDAAALRSFYRKLIADRGYKVLEAADGERALRTAESCSENISLLLTDVSLPKRNGPALAKILTQQRPGIKVLFMSGYADNVVLGAERILEPGTDFIQKPFTAEELFKKIRDLLDSKEDLPANPPVTVQRID